MENIKKVLQKRGIRGDALLDVIDTIESIREVNGVVDEKGYAILYHATSEQKAELILKEQQMFGIENGLFFSTKTDGEIKGYGNTVLVVSIPVEKLMLDDDFGDELHFRVEVKPHQKVRFSIRRLEVKI